MLREAESRYAEAARLSAASAVLAGNAWDEVPLSALDSWQPQALASRIAALQLLVCRGADGYVTDMLTTQDIDSQALGSVRPTTFAGVAGDGRSLVTLLDEPRIQAKMLIGDGMGARDAWNQARESLRLMSVTAVQDAGRAADSVAMVARPAATGYVRMLNLPSCARCTLLAGKFFRWNAGFSRHPRCDCRHIPSSEGHSRDLRLDPRAAIEAGKVTGISRADMKAILDGADVSQVINAQRGMYEATVLGRNIKGTLEATTVRGGAGKFLSSEGERLLKRTTDRYRRVQIPRLRPETIYKIAGDDRGEALRLLKRFGYLT